jgi:hypothetical protein
VFCCGRQRLSYRHNFQGLFNDISQVTYFHYPEYVREAQSSVDKLPEKAMNTLPCLSTIIPHLGVLHDDESKLPFGSRGGGQWAWVVSVKRVYLWDARNQRLLKSRGGGVYDLAAFYLLNCHGMSFFGKKKDLDEEQESEIERARQIKMTDYGHARLKQARR